MRAISQENFDRFMARVHASGWTYPEGKMDTPERFMVDAVWFRIRPLGNPFHAANITMLDPQAGRIGLMLENAPWGAETKWIDVDDLAHWEPAT